MLVRGRSWFLALLATASSAACSGADEEPHDRPRPPATTTEAHESAHEDEAPPATSRPDDVPLVRAQRSMMGTVYQISVVGEDEVAAQTAMGHALDEIDRLETLLSEWRDDSEISRINAAAGRAPVQVGPETMTIIDAGLVTAEQTNGAFDITWAALRGLYLFQRGEERVPTDAEIAERLPLVGYRDVVVDHAASTVFLRRPGMAIGTGGIAKGYALDRAQEILVREGFPNFMMFGGGQVQLRGMRGDRVWRVGIQHPRREDYIGYLDATDCAIATAGDYEHSFIDDEGRRWHHIIDLSTGRPAQGVVQVTVLTRTGLDADAIDTGCFIMGVERCLDMLSRMPGYEAVIVDSDMRVHMTPGARDRVTFRVPLDEGRIPL
ncbi:MAG: FAD:protein FMN transferase [Deltaproteobacteria bacterium]|nr:FAD:protein FMN transferase [Deltaproteobacteria bacterium]